MDAFEKVVRLGSIKIHGERASNIYCEIKYDDKGRLSISGVEGPMSNGDCKGSCGQIVMHLRGNEKEINPAPGWDVARLVMFFALWDKWHLNDMQAGTPEQMAELDKHVFDAAKENGLSHYDWAKRTLEEAGLQPHNGYSYGSAWLKVDVPEYVLDFLKSLPDTDMQPAWV